MQRSSVKSEESVKNNSSSFLPTKPSVYAEQNSFLRRGSGVRFGVCKAAFPLTAMGKAIKAENWRLLSDIVMT